jgi:hypothetical protein
LGHFADAMAHCGATRCSAAIVVNHRTASVFSASRRAFALAAFSRRRMELSVIKHHSTWNFGRSGRMWLIGEPDAPRARRKVFFDMYERQAS